MSNIFWKKTFPLCSFSISKCLPTTTTHSPPRLSDADDANDNQYASLSSSYSSSSIVVKNFNSLYNELAGAASSAGSTSKSAAATDDFFFSSSSSDIDSDHSYLPDFAAVFASQRFFFSSPGKSNSITDSKPAISATAGALISPPIDGVEVRKYSVDPYVDFRRSMQEMIDARNDHHDKSDLEYLHELLSWFLALNPRDTHKYIISAFSDIVVDMLSAPDRAHRHREVKLRRQRNRLRRLSM